MFVLIIVTLNFVVIFFIFINNDFQGRCRRSPGAPLKKSVLRCTRYLVTGLSEIKGPKSFVNIMYYLVINRRNKQNINFSQNGGFSKKNFDFYQNFSLKLFIK